MSSGTSSARAKELKSEQSRFDAALRAREGQRESLSRGLTAGAADAWAAQALARSRQGALQAMGPRDASVAFGRLDFLATGDTIYVGNGLIEADGVMVVNWRAPIAEPYYRASVGDTMGLRLRRKFETERNRILSFHDEVFVDILRRVAALHEPSDPQERERRAATHTRPTQAPHRSQEAEESQEPTTDDALLRSLEADRSAEMRDIAKTIQASQYELIAAPAEGALIVQGGAGTGKTAVALHRVSLLLYRERERLGPSDVLVIGPSERFNQFVQSVLPSLGDAGVQHGDLLSMGPISSSGRTEDEALAKLKGDTRMAAVLRRALYDRVRARTDSSGTLTIGQGGSVARFTADELNVRLRQLAKDNSYEQGRRHLRQWLSAEASMRTRSRTAVNARLLDSAVERMWPRVSAVDVLAGLFASQSLLTRCAADVLSQDEVAALERPPRPIKDPGQWSRTDVALLDELWSLIEGRQRTYKHVVVDEAQDLSDMQWRSVLRRCGRGGSCTLVGDIAQSTGPFARHDWSEVESHFQRLGAVTVSELKFGYRVPRQVFDLAARLLPTAAPGVTVPTSVRRGPSEPQLRCVASETLIDDVVQQAEDLVAAGQYVAVIAAEEALSHIAAGLRRRAVQYDGHGNTAAQTGLSLLTPVQAKGLEFDAVVVVEPSAIVEDSVTGLRELYIALTRTTRHLHVIHTHRFVPLDLSAWMPPEPPLPVAVQSPDASALIPLAVETLRHCTHEERRRFVDELASELGLTIRSPSADADPGPPAESESGIARPAQTALAPRRSVPAKRRLWRNKRDQAAPRGAAHED
jgi:DNA helicase IV